ncbi:MAG: type IV pilus modification protein PilV [Pseudomonadota bacterium]|nr:type IV pilus modification protein PilV [Pseudomonadota bacterium]
MSVTSKHALRHPVHQQPGFTLIEVLIAVLVLSLGLLGLAGLQATSLRYNNAAAARGQATFLAYDIIDRMRANKTAAIAGSYDTIYDTAPSSGGSDCQTTGAGCSAAAMAAYDLNQWHCLLGKWNSTGVCSNTLGINRGLLPDGDGAISRAGNVVTVRVRWTETGWGDSDNDGIGEREAIPLELTIGAEL